MVLPFYLIVYLNVGKVVMIKVSLKLRGRMKSMRKCCGVAWPMSVDV